MRHKKNIVVISMIFSLAMASACKKYLEMKPDKSLSTISSAKDLQSLLDNMSLVQTAGADETSADDYILSFQSYQALSEQQRNMHTWQKNNLFIPVGALKDAWATIYDNVYVANTVLDNMDKVERNGVNGSQLDDTKGQALFLRAFSFFRAASIWCLAYDSNTSKTDLGLPLRLNSDFNEPSLRSSVEDTYKQIINDAVLASELLPNLSIHVTRPSKAAAFALLSKIYLAKRDYLLAEKYANSCLAIKSSLIDYNSLNTAAAFPITAMNVEIIYEAQLYGNSIQALSTSRGARINPQLYASYDTNDLRKAAFFAADGTGNYNFKGSYSGTANLFGGLAVDEIMLIKAETAARNNSLDVAYDTLNKLLIKRYRVGSYVPLSGNDKNALIDRILIERRKEMPMRGARWLDVKRLNKEGANISLQRNLNGTVYRLEANDLRFALPLPDDIIERSGMQQNPR